MTSLQGHAAVVTLIGYMENSQKAIVMKLYDGSLSSLIDDLILWPVLPFVNISQQVASALAELSRYGIVHCDLKKNNVLYDFNTEGNIRVYITDFGVSQVLLGTEKVQTRVNVRIKALSVAYASPQVLVAWLTLREDAKIETEVNLATARSKTSPTGTEALPSRDVYALGILMHECLFRERAWNDKPLNEVYRLVVVEEKRPSF